MGYVIIVKDMSLKKILELTRGKNYKINFQNIISKIKKSGENKEYDCIAGVSGGVDSTYVAYLLASNGIKPLLVHFDNGWNSELAVSNIEKMVQKLKLDLYTNVMDWEAFKEVQVSFLKSSTTDCEIPTDHAINATLLNLANKFKVRYIINGMNFATEGMSVPAWSYGHSDWRYIKDVMLKNGAKKSSIKKLPHFSLFKLAYSLLIKRIKIVSILNYIHFDKEEVLKTIIKELDYRPYAQKHYESIYTRFFQGYFLIEKFSIDKRRGQYSDLIRSKQITRENALEMISKPAYESNNQLENDKDFVTKKLGLTKNELNRILKQKNKSYKDYRNQKQLIYYMKSIYNILRKIGIQPK